MNAPADLLKTPLNGVHRALGAKMVDFGGWDMPVEYSSLIEEHCAVRQRVGVFDVSHMGEIEVRGPQALALVQHVTVNDASKLAIGQAQYSALLYDHGGFVDDILVHKVADDEYFLCVNASNQDKDFAHITEHNPFQATVENAGPKYAQIAVQGQLAKNTLNKLLTPELLHTKRYHFLDGSIAGVPARIARTGYTGEDGWELYLAPENAVHLWQEILTAGTEFGILPCGLGARNTLRMEAAMPLYGHEIHASISPWEAGLDWIVKLDKGYFIGRESLIQQKQKGITRKLTGFEIIGRGIGRDGYEIQVGGVGAGWVTSGGPSPTLNKNIGMCYMPNNIALGTAIEVMVRGRGVAAQTVPLPFYKRAK